MITICIYIRYRKKEMQHVPWNSSGIPTLQENSKLEFHKYYLWNPPVEFPHVDLWNIRVESTASICSMEGPWKCVHARRCLRPYALRAVDAVVARVSLTYVPMARRPRLSMYSRERIKVLLQGGASISEIVNRLKSEGIITCRQTVWRFQCHLRTHGFTSPLPKSGRRTKLSGRVYNP